jgi:hypothetical protein
MIMNRLFLTFVVLFCIFLVALPAQAKYSGGTGEPNNPYQIANANDMNEIGTHPEDWGSHFLLVNDINLADYTGTQFNIIGTSSSSAFTGVFDGNGHSISNFSYNSTGANYIGLFGCVSGLNSTVKNLTLIDPNINAGTGYCAGLIGRIVYGTIWNCGVKGGSVSGYRFISGLVGYNSGEISNCYSSATVLGNTQIGGLVGGASASGTISDSYATGSVSGLVSVGVGGLIGDIDGGRIVKCYATGNVIGCDIIGGLVGESKDGSLITECYATGDVFGNGFLIGGLAGYTGECDSITNCYAAGAVSGDMFVGGLIGEVEFSEIANCYARGYVDGNDFIGGFIASNASEPTACFWDVETSGLTDGGDGVSSGVIGKTSAEMKKESTFTNWDFVEIWNIGENQTYPYLRAYPTGDLNHNGIVNMADFAIFAEHWLEGVE